jgi:hypothetical protein
MFQQAADLNKIGERRGGALVLKVCCMNMRAAQLAFVVITVASIGAALFRVATAPDRIRERRNVAYSTCVSSGGQWMVVDRTEICRKPETASLPIQQGGEIRRN